MSANHIIPEHIVKQYGSAHAFKAHKRKVVREISRLLSDLRLGAAFFPSGGNGIDIIDRTLKDLSKELSVKEWGR